MKTQELFYLDTLPHRANDDYKDLAAYADFMGRVYGLKSITRRHKQHLNKEAKERPFTDLVKKDRPTYPRVLELIVTERQKQGAPTEVYTVAALKRYDHIDISDILLALAIYLEVIFVIILLFSLAFHQ
ncbi:hypothetical protein SAMN05421788_10392 [Filimonas lacunae]|uniref:Uncharacterized protein n=1 Tax=Filimonas lacunae TaxID=477680 RepID=A0A173MJR4_9BACT|nr:hypothetical protein [Filimonas lacunae]BAV07740.1 hypothetical protein FLA_3771 [Filimonas lacunae]SIT04278.1 hypothetical protein SAMN05421788_10392 [Filimonas lacunae]